MSRHVFLHTGNAEEVLHEALELVKNKVAFDNRREAFEECTRFWGEHIGEIIREPISNEEKLAQIQKIFEVK